MTKYKLIRYILQDAITREYEEFPITSNWELAREYAVERALEMKEARNQDNPYLNITLTLEIIEVATNKTRHFNVLNGKRMHTPDILQALEWECEIIHGAGIEPTITETNSDGKVYKVVLQHFIKLYYFTAS